MNRADVRFFERAERVFESAARGRVGRLAARNFEGLAKAQLELAGRLLRKSYGDDPVHLRAVGGENLDNAPDELGRLPGAGRGFDDERLVERIQDRVPSVGIGQ